MYLAHDLSVLPAGMAVDLRIPARASARAWLQNALLALEREGLDPAAAAVQPESVEDFEGLAICRGFSQAFGESVGW